MWKNQALIIHQAHVVDANLQPAGKRITFQELPAMITSHGIFVIDALQPAGKNIMEGKTFLRGARGWEE